MKKLVLLRHGESVWNKENRFTGWTDVDLSEKGVQEGKEAGIEMKKAGIIFDMAFTSVLTRAIKTMNFALAEMDQLWIPVVKSWRLNEKHYGDLQGLNKAETAEKYGDAQVKIWRRSFDIPSGALGHDDPRNPRFDRRYKDLTEAEIPLTESLKDTIARLIPYWEGEIKPALTKMDTILVAAHGNSLRGIVKYLKNISDADIIELNLPTGIPYVFEFDDDMNLQKDYFLAEPEKLKALMDAVANQGKSK